MSSNNNNNKHVKSQSNDTTYFNIYELNPTFYEKIISRSSSFRFTHSSSFKTSTGKIPFVWETHPGTPRPDISLHDEIEKPIRLPPAIHSLTVPKPSFPPTGVKAYFIKILQKLKNLDIQIPKIETHMPKMVNSVIKIVKVYLLKNVKKVGKIKSSVEKKAKSLTTTAAGDEAEADENMRKSDKNGSESSFSGFKNSTPPFKNSGNTKPSVISPASPRDVLFKLPKMLRFQDMQKGRLKWSFVKRNNGNY